MKTRLIPVVRSMMVATLKSNRYYCESRFTFTGTISNMQYVDTQYAKREKILEKILNILFKYEHQHHFKFLSIS